MVDITLNIYDEWRQWIRRTRSHGVTWESIRYGENSDETGLKSFIHSMVTVAHFGDGHTEISPDTWYRLVESERHAEEEQLAIEERTRNSMLVDDSLDNSATISTAPGSAWQLYRKHLKTDMGFTEYSLTQIESSCFRILKRMSSDTTQTSPVKGLVIGNVQSGKTANMAGLMAMAADNGWNMFIILSGTIENLRRQTETRLSNDLNSGEGNLIWQALNRDDLKKKANASSGQTRHLQLGERSKWRYFAVCLKNKTRLVNMIKWLQADPNAQKNLRILVIDDEADQASINTGDVTQGDADRKAINKLIVSLVEGKTHTAKPCESFYRAMNYVCYTATPYANFLNENYPDSLYPKDFLIALQPSLQYFGPTQIFGSDDENASDGMRIIRTIDRVKKEDRTEDTVDEYDLVKQIHEDGALTPPESLWDSLAWFLCSVAAMRHTGYKKPISMLIHTSTKQQHHSNFARVIKEMLNPQNRGRLFERCCQVYERETKAFTKSDLREAYPDYERMQEEIPDYPAFTDIVPGIELLLNTEVTAIPMNEDHDEMQYHAGIHLCIDNCANNGINDENMFVRLVYPDSNADHYPSPAPAFIVVGGSTLSRGLTIEGLVSTYFPRNVRQADSLMQMGRWFGYRRNYELYPRLWMLEETKEQFEFMTQLDNELREELKLFHLMGKKPLEYGPKVKNTPKASFLRITAKNRMQMASEVDFDFSGIRTETITFPNNEQSLQQNIGATDAFIQSLPQPSEAYDGRGYVWRNINFARVKTELLNKCVFATEGKVFNQLDAFLKWIDKVTSDGALNEWNIALAGGRGEPTALKTWVPAPGLAVKKIRRNNKYSNNNPDLLVIGAVRDPKDLIIDVDLDELKENAPEIYGHIRESGYVINQHYLIRNKAGFEKNPLLIIYCIDKDSEPSRLPSPEQTPTRKKLNAKADVIAFSITIPGIATAGNLSRKLQIKAAITDSATDEDDET